MLLVLIKQIAPSTSGRMMESIILLKVRWIPNRLEDIIMLMIWKITQVKNISAGARDFLFVAIIKSPFY